MVGKIAIITGPPGAGKTTICQRLREAFPEAVYIDGDAVRRFAPADARAVLGGGSTYRAAGALSRAYLEMGAELVLVDYVFRNPTDIARFTSQIHAETELSVFVVWTPLDVAIERAKQRGRQTSSDDVRRAWKELAEQRTKDFGRFVSNDTDAKEAARAIEHEIRSVCA
ncbi:MAG: zeta toxin family protein [Deltaproteobacteria bacterium]|jgi:dephospho-CoA kinase